jgi:hypothetical protein
MVGLMVVKMALKLEDIQALEMVVMLVVWKD